MMIKNRWMKAAAITIACLLLLPLTACNSSPNAGGSSSAHAPHPHNRSGWSSSSGVLSGSSGSTVMVSTPEVKYAPGTSPNREPPAFCSSAVSSSVPHHDNKPRKLGIRVLFYHDIMTTAQKGSMKNGLVMTDEDFDHQMSLLKQAGYHTASLDDLYAYIQGRKELDPQNTIILTFDDGYRTNGYLAGPILRKYGFTATVFVITKFLDYADSPVNTTTFFPLQYFIYTDIPKFSDTLSFASHTDNMHDNYKGQPMLISEPEDAILKDLQLSRTKLSNTPYLAYPFGKFDNRTIELLKKAGFTMAFTTQSGMVYPGTDCFRVPRYEINAPITDARFKFFAGISC